MKEMFIRLPWPPSVNQIWATTNKGNWFSTKQANDFKEMVILLTRQLRKPQFKDDDRLAVTLLAYPPDNRRRDLDNLFKVVGDSLQEARVFRNDCQIKKIIMEMLHKDKEGKGFVTVTIQVMEG